jgi:hypothetical protein
VGYNNPTLIDRSLQDLGITQAIEVRVLRRSEVNRRFLAPDSPDHHEVIIGLEPKRQE